MLAIKECFFLFYSDWVSTKKLKTLGFFYSSPLVASSSPSRTLCYLCVSEITIQYLVSHVLSACICLDFNSLLLFSAFFFLLRSHLLHIFTASLHSVLDRFISIEFRPQPTSATCRSKCYHVGCGSFYVVYNTMFDFFQRYPLYLLLDKSKNV